MNRFEAIKRHDGVFTLEVNGVVFLRAFQYQERAHVWGLQWLSDSVNPNKHMGAASKVFVDIHLSLLWVSSRCC